MTASTLPPPYPTVRFSVDEYHRLAASGILDENERVELLEGCLVPKMTHSPQHANAIELLSELLQKILPPGWRIRVQLPITTEDSEPEPDLAIVRRERQTTDHPVPMDIGLVIEIADASLSRDRIDKARLYARSGIAEYWIVNLRDRQLEVFQVPTTTSTIPHYQTPELLTLGQTVELKLDGQVAAVIKISDIIPESH